MAEKKTFVLYKQLRDEGASDAILEGQGWHKLLLSRFTKKYGASSAPAGKPLDGSGDPYEDDSEGAGKVIDVEVAAVSEPEKPSKKGKGISADTVGWLCAAAFMMQANRSHEQEWILTKGQQKQLGELGAECAKSIPAPIAKMVDDYAAPAVFLVAIADVIKTKKTAIEAKYIAQRNAQVNRSPADTAYSEAPPPVESAAATNGRAGVAEPENLRTIFE